MPRVTKVNDLKHEDAIMSYTRIMGIWVNDETEYAKYRQGMMPILQSYGGAFGYDFRVSEVLKSKEQAPINWVFTIEFPNQQAMDEFFDDPTYLAVKKAHFDRSVTSRTTIALF